MLNFYENYDTIFLVLITGWTSVGSASTNKRGWFFPGRWCPYSVLDEEIEGFVRAGIKGGLGWMKAGHVRA